MNDRARWRRLARRLITVTAAYNALEAGIAIWAGVVAASIALVGFGLDSLIELAAALAVLYRLGAGREGESAERVEHTERRVRRFVGWTFLALAVYVAFEAGIGLWHHERPAESPLGIGLACASLVIMPMLAWWKLRAATALGSRALAAEAKETLACAYLSGCLLAGLGLHAALGWWWADSMAALAMVPWLLHEAHEAMEDEPCP